MKSAFTVELRDGAASTRGLLPAVGFEIELPALAQDVIGEARPLLETLGNYSLTLAAPLKAGETVEYGYWLLQLQQARKGVLELWERCADGHGVQAGANLTLRYWKAQHDACHRAGAPFAPPRPDMLVAVAPGVLEGEPVEGVRYPHVLPMSGWWLFTRHFTGDVSVMRTEHLFHVTAARPDLAEFIALPPGYRFNPRRDPTIQFDKSVAESDPV